LKPEKKPVNSNYFFLYPAIFKEVFSDPLKGDGVKFTAMVILDNQEFIKKSFTIDSKNNKRDQKWFEMRLGPFHQNIKKFSLLLETDFLKTNTWDWAGWGGFEWDTEQNKLKEYQFKKIYDKEMKIYENTHFIPRLHPISKIRCSNSEEDTIKQMRYNEVNMKNIGIVLDKNCKPKTFNLKDISLTNQTFDDQRVSFTYSSPEESYVILSNTYYPGWKLKINGHEKPIQRINYAFQGLDLPKGKNIEVEVIYDPLSFKLGFFVTLISLGFCLIILFKYGNRKI